MPTQITNTASLTFEYGSEKGCATSNTAATTLQETLSISKSSLGCTYSPGNDIFYIITISNNNSAAVMSVKISDDLGTYCLGAVSISPLTYAGPAELYIDGAFQCELEPKIYKNKIVFTVDEIPCHSNAMIIYKAVPNCAAPLELDSVIENTASLTSKCLAETIKASNVVKIANKAEVKIVKSMAPNPVLAGEKLTYTFFLYNYGNTEATNVVLTDKFGPAPLTVCVAVNGAEVPFKDYTYINDTLTMPAFGSRMALTIPAAKFKQDPLTGVVTTEPGCATITVTGRI